MNKNDENRVLYLLDCCDINGKITLNKDDMLLILEYQRELGRADGIHKFAERIVEKMKSLQFHTGRAWFDFDAGIDRCIEIVHIGESKI